MARKEALRLASEAGCLPSEASAVLEAEPQYERAKLVVESILESRRKLYLPRLSQTWAQFATPETAKELGVNETIAFLEQLGRPMEDPVLLAVAYELQVPEVGKLTFDGFVDGWARLEAGEVVEMRESAVPGLAKRMQSDFAYFRDVYRFTFQLNLGSSGRLLDYATASAYWQLLLAPLYPSTISEWLAFTGTAPKAVSSDTWNMLLEFCVYAAKDPDLANYDDTMAWPAIVDDFVDYLKGSK